MKILHLTLKKKWFDMILSGEKLEEYREIKPYWDARLSKHKYTHIKFTNGYGKDKPAFIIEIKELLRGLGLISWGGTPFQSTYIFRLGKIIKKLNLCL